MLKKEPHVLKANKYLTCTMAGGNKPKRAWHSNGQSIKPFKQLYSCVADPKELKQIYVIQSTANRERVGAICFKRSSYTVGGVTAEYSCSLIVDGNWNDFKNATGTNSSRTSTEEQRNQWKKFRNECGWDLVEGVMPLDGRTRICPSERGVLLAHKRVSTIEEFRQCNTEDKFETTLRHATRVSAVDELNKILVKNPIPSEDVLHEWATKNYTTLLSFVQSRDPTVSDKAKANRTQWLNTFITERTSSGKGSSERKKSLSDSAHFSVGTNGKALIGGVSTNVNRKTKLPPKLFNKKSDEFVANIFDSINATVNKTIVDSGAGPALDISGARYLQASRVVKSALTSQAGKSNVVTTLQGICDAVQERLYQNDPRFLDLKPKSLDLLGTKRKSKKAESHLDSDEETEIEYDSDDEVATPPKKKPAAKKKPKPVAGAKSQGEGGEARKVPPAAVGYTLAQ